MDPTGTTSRKFRRHDSAKLHGRLGEVGEQVTPQAFLDSNGKLLQT
jgi:hypothetical protein